MDGNKDCVGDETKQGSESDTDTQRDRLRKTRPGTDTAEEPRLRGREKVLGKLSPCAGVPGAEGLWCRRLAAAEGAGRPREVPLSLSLVLKAHDLVLNLQNPLCLSASQFS